MIEDVRRRLKQKLQDEVEMKVIEMIDEIEIGDFLSDTDIKVAVSDAITEKLKDEIDEMLDDVVAEVIDDLI